jgi:hypothetical protein
MWKLDLVYTLCQTSLCLMIDHVMCYFCKMKTNLAYLFPLTSCEKSDTPVCHIYKYGQTFFKISPIFSSSTNIKGWAFASALYPKLWVKWKNCRNYKFWFVPVSFASKILQKSVHLFISQHLWYFLIPHIYQRSLICAKAVCPRHGFLIYWNIHDQLD